MHSKYFLFLNSHIGWADLLLSSYCSWSYISHMSIKLTKFDGIYRWHTIVIPSQLSKRNVPVIELRTITIGCWQILRILQLLRKQKTNIVG